MPLLPSRPGLGIFHIMPDDMGIASSALLALPDRPDAPLRVGPWPVLWRGTRVDVGGSFVAAAWGFGRGRIVFRQVYVQDGLGILPG
jgi:hypothetical protein